MTKRTTSAVFLILILFVGSFMQNSAAASQSRSGCIDCVKFSGGVCWYCVIVESDAKAICQAQCNSCSAWMVCLYKKPPINPESKTPELPSTVISDDAVRAVSVIDPGAGLVLVYARKVGTVLHEGHVVFQTRADRPLTVQDVEYALNPNTKAARKALKNRFEKPIPEGQPVVVSDYQLAVDYSPEVARVEIKSTVKDTVAIESSKVVTLNFHNQNGKWAMESLNVQ
jgi:hypothetical protein